MARLWATTGDAACAPRRGRRRVDGRALPRGERRAVPRRRSGRSRTPSTSGLRESGVRKTTDGGATWDDCALPEPGVFSLAVERGRRRRLRGNRAEPAVPQRRRRRERGASSTRSARASVTADVELPAAAVDVARALDRAEPARRRPAPRRDRARRPHALDRRRRDVGGPPARTRSRTSTRSPGTRASQGRAYEAGGGGSAWSEDARRDVAARRTTAATATTRGRSPSIRTIPTAGTSPRAPGPFAAHGGRDPQARIYRRRGGEPWQALDGGLARAASARCRTRSSPRDGRLFAGLADGQLWAERRPRRHVARVPRFAATRCRRSTRSHSQQSLSSASGSP